MNRDDTHVAVIQLVTCQDTFECPDCVTEARMRDGERPDECTCSTP